jgi:dolichol kinase
LILLNTCETTGILNRIYNTRFIKYTRNEKERGITCGVNTVLSVLIALLISQMEIANATNFRYLFYCVNLTILFSYSYWILNIIIRVYSNIYRTVVGIISIAILYFIISNCAEYSGISRLYYVIPCLICAVDYYFLIVDIKGSFTLSEGSIVAQGFTLLINESMIYCTSKLNLVKHPSIFNFERSDIFSMLEVLIVGSILTYFILIPLFQKVLSCYNKKNDKHYLSEDREQYRILYQKYSIYSWAGLIILILTCLMPYSTHIIHQNPFIWVIKYVFVTRRLFLVCWWLCLLSTIVIAFNWLMGKTKTLSDLNNKRKFYHMLSVLMFFPGYLIDRDFMFLSFSVAFSGMIMAEVIRFFKLYPLGEIIHKFMTTFIDQKDTGTAILSHIYLLIGCALPVWLNSLSSKIIPGVSGILALGIGDTMASIIGYRYGKTHWPKSKKTVEGTCGFIASIILFIFITSIFYSYEYTVVQWVKFVLFVILTGLLEAESNQNDNLILPLFLFSLTSTI